VSYEGHMQRWCANGHHWETEDMLTLSAFYHDAKDQLARDATCPDCGQRNVAYNSVDDTNLDNAYEVPIKDRLPTVAEMRQHGAKAYWHTGILDDSLWQASIESIDDPRERQRMYEWAAKG
jgi:hypothetical protein